MRPLHYASPGATPTGRSAAEWVLVVINTVAAAASLALVPLTAHIFGCDESKKWCHLQALVLGGPLSVVVLLLGALTLSKLPVALKEPLRRGLPLFGPLAVSVTILALLWIAVAADS